MDADLFDVLGASESESEDGTGTGTGDGVNGGERRGAGRHRYSRSLTGDVPPLPVPPNANVRDVEKGAGAGVVYSEPEALNRGVKEGRAEGTDNEGEDDDTPRKSGKGNANGNGKGLTRGSALDLFGTPLTTKTKTTKTGIPTMKKTHRYSISDASYLKRHYTGDGEGHSRTTEESQGLGQVERHATGDSVNAMVNVNEELPADPKTWTVNQLSTYLVNALGGAGSCVPTPVSNDLVKFVRTKRITGRAFLKLGDGELREWGVNQLWRVTLMGERDKLRVEAGEEGENGVNNGEDEGGRGGRETSVDDPLPRSGTTSSGFDETWTFMKGSRRIRGLSLEQMKMKFERDNDNDNDDEDGEGGGGGRKGRHSRSSSVASSASASERGGRVRDMVDSLERSASASSGSGLDEEGSTSETGSPSLGGSPKKTLPSRGRVDDLFGPPTKLKMEEEDDEATMKKRKAEDVTITNKTRALNGREPRLLPLSGGAHRYADSPALHQPINQGAYSDYELGFRKGYQPPHPMNYPQQYPMIGGGQMYAQPQLHSQYQPQPQPHPQYQSQPQLHPQHQPHYHPHHRIASPQTQVYVVRHNPSPGLGMGGGVASPDTSTGITSPNMSVIGSGGGSGRRSTGSTGSAGKRLLPYPPIVREAELYHPRPKRVIGVWDGEEEQGDKDKEGGKDKEEKGNNEKEKEKEGDAVDRGSTSGSGSGVEGYITALQTPAASSSSSSATLSSSSLSSAELSGLDNGVEDDGGDADADKTFRVKVHGEDEGEEGGEELSIEELLKRDVGTGKTVQGAEAWEMELGETVKRISGLSGGGGRLGRSVRGPRLSGGAGVNNIGVGAGGVHNIDVGVGVGVNNIGAGVSGGGGSVGGNGGVLGVHGDGTMSVGDVSEIGRWAARAGVSARGKRDKEGGGGTRRGGVLDLFDIRGEEAGVQEKGVDVVEGVEDVDGVEDKEGHRIADRERDLDTREKALDSFQEVLDRRGV
ncbi:hypothetical protein CVT24_004178, partial [Panaeolus cyanescens]